MFSSRGLLPFYFLLFIFYHRPLPRPLPYPLPRPPKTRRPLPTPEKNRGIDGYGTPYPYTEAGLYGVEIYPLGVISERGTAQNPIPFPVRGPLPIGPVPSNLGIISPLIIKYPPIETAFKAFLSTVSARYLLVSLFSSLSFLN